jgi:hypothetical protein
MQLSSGCSRKKKDRSQRSTRVYRFGNAPRWWWRRSIDRQRIANGGAGKLHRNAGGNHALEIHAGLVNPNGAVILVVDPNDCVGVDIFGLANEFA